MNCYLKVLIGLAAAIVLPAVIPSTVALAQNLVNSDNYASTDDSCTLTGNSLDNFESMQKECTNIIIKDFTVPAGKTLSLTNLTSGSTVTFQGTITFDYAEWDGLLIIVSGTNITVIGESGSLLDGNGSRWWDGLGGNGGKLKPKFFRALNLFDSVVKGLNVRNTPKHSFSIMFSQNVVFSDITIDNLDGDDNGGHNTDAFDLSESNNITIQNSHVVNQDDCMAINSGTNYNFLNNYCSGGHGISIGSVGNRTNNVVKNVHVKNCTVVNSENGIRIKTVYNAVGEVTNVKYEDITMGNITDYGILVRGDYKNSGPTNSPTAGVPIKNFTLNNVHGWVQTNAVNVLIFLADGVATDWKWTNVNVTGSKFVNENCTGIPENSGVVC